MSNKAAATMDRQGRDRRSERTQEALIDALISLLTVKRYDAISIKEIVDEADVGRSTFYAHYQTKDDLLLAGLGRVLDALVEHVEINVPDRSVRWDTTWFFSHAKQHYELYRTLTWGSGFKLLIQDGHAALSARLSKRLAPLASDSQESSVPLPILSYAMAGTLLLLLKWWLDNKMPYTPKRMDEIFHALVGPAVKTP